MRHRPSGFFMLRTPLLAFDELERWAAQGDIDATRAGLRALIARPDVREAIATASPALDEGIESWLADPRSEAGKKIERGLARYITRMATRATPFGLMAGSSIGTLAKTTHLELPPRTTYRRHARIDCDHLTKLCDVLAAELANELRYVPNTSLYTAAGKLRYARRIEGIVRSYVLVAIDPTEHVEAVLARARRGARRHELAQVLVGDDITLDEALAYVDELIAAQLLVPELEPQLTGDDALGDVIGQLRSLAPTRDDAPAHVAAQIAHSLTLVGSHVAELEAAPLGDRSTYSRIQHALGELPVAVEPGRMVQVDLEKPSSKLTLASSVVRELAQIVEKLRTITPRPESAMTRFRAAFEARYEAREVPLVEALDDEAGIGLYGRPGPGLDPSPLLDGLPFAGDSSDEIVTLTRGARHLAHRVGRAIEAGQRELVLDDADWAALALDADDAALLPDAYAIRARVHAVSAEAIDRGDYVSELELANGPSGATLLGRFCHVNPELRALVSAHMRDEEACAPDAIYAEVVHLPSGRMGNISSRPVLRAHEIVLLARSGAAADHQITVDDLLLSVRRGRFVLRSARLGREVRPRLTSAHDYGVRSLAIYQFLCALGRMERPPLMWTFGALEALPHLPAVRAGRVLLARERWRLSASDLAPLAGPEGSAALKALADRLRWPRWIAIVDGENELAIDLENALAVDSATALLRTRQDAIIRTAALDALPVRGDGGRYTHELVIPMVADLGGRVASASAPASTSTAGTSTAGTSTAGTSTAGASPAVARRFLPGSEWLYARLYAGNVSADRVLDELVAPLVAHEPKWFFLRYDEGGWHVRLRIHGEPQRLARDMLPALHAAAEPLLARGVIARVQLDTYEREVERYGGPHGIALAEQLFHTDSVACLGIVQLLDASGGLDVRWRLALRGIDQLLDDLGLDLEARLAVVERERDDFAREHGVDAAFGRVLGERYRSEQASLVALLDRTQDESSDLAPALALLDARSRANMTIVGELRAAASRGMLARPVEELARSFVHMHANRLLRSSARAHELVIYDLLCRLYRSRRARRV